MFGPLLDVPMSLRVAGARDCAPCQKAAKREGFVAVSKTMAGVGHLKRIWKDAFHVAGAVQETHELDVLRDQGEDFLRGVAFWSMRSSALRRWFCVTGAALRMTWPHFCLAGAIAAFLMLSSSKIHYTTLKLQVQLQLQLQLHCITLHYAILHDLHYTTLRYTNCTPLHATPLHSTALRHTTPHYTTLHYITLHYTTTTATATPTTTLLYTTSHSTSLHYTTLPYITLHSLHHHTCNKCSYTTLITLHYSYNSDFVCN